MKKRAEEVFHNNLVEENMMQNPVYQSFHSDWVCWGTKDANRDLPAGFPAGGVAGRNPQKNKAVVGASH